MTTTTASIINHFLNRSDILNSTKKCYLSSLKRFAKAYGSTSINQITSDNIKDYLTGLSQQINYTTHNRHQATLSSLFSYAMEQGYRETNPVSKIKYLKPRQTQNEHHNESPIRYLSAKQLSILYQLLKTYASQPRFYRLQTIVHLLHRSGARVSELLKLNLADLDQNAHKFEVLGKGNKTRWCYYDSETAKGINRYIQEYRPQHSNHPALFLSQHPKSRQINRLSYRTLYGDWQTLIATSEIHHCRIHDLRHTFATERVGLMGIEELRALMGHEDIQTTLRYPKVTSARAETVAQQALISLSGDQE